MPCLVVCSKLFWPFMCYFFIKDHLFVYTEPCLHKTPKRSLSRKSRIPTFSSPVNDTDIQQEIFWDPHSPIAHRLGNTNEIQISVRLFEVCSGSVWKVIKFLEKKSPFLLSWLGCLVLFLLKNFTFFNVVLNQVLILARIFELFEMYCTL